MTVEHGYSSIYDSIPFSGGEESLYSLITGHFVVERDPETKKIMPETMRLCDDTARIYHEMASVSFLWNVANELEGKKKFPRPFIYEKKSADAQAADVLISSGDKVAILYANGSIYTPLVIGSIESIATPRQHKDLFIDPENLDRQIERYENADYLFEAENDGRGALKFRIEGKEAEGGNDGGTGEITIDVVGTKGAGKVTLNASGVLAMNQKNDKGETVQRFTLDNTTDGESITLEDVHGNKIETSKDGIKNTGQKDAKSEHAVYGETLVSKIKAITKAIGEIIVMTPAGTSSRVSDFPANKAAFKAIDDAISEILIT